MSPAKPAAKAALEVLSEAREKLNFLYPEDTPEKINSGLMHSFTEINKNPLAILSVEAVVALYSRLRLRLLLPTQKAPDQENRR